MATTYTLISSNVLTSSAASITFSSIPATYTDLVLRISARGDDASLSIETKIVINSDSTAKYSNTTLIGNGASASSTQSATASGNNYVQARRSPGSTATSNTFSNTEIYFPNYNSTSSKPISVADAMETNGTTAFVGATANLYTGTSGISSLVLSLNSANFVSGSSFYLYGISNA